MVFIKASFACLAVGRRRRPSATHKVPSAKASKARWLSTAEGGLRTPSESLKEPAVPLSRFLYFRINILI